jgi:hypothetical protein
MLRKFSPALLDALELTQDVEGEQARGLPAFPRISRFLELRHIFRHRGSESLNLGTNDGLERHAPVFAKADLGFFQQRDV